MELREAIYIRTVAECQSITKAAEKLYISQPSLSNFIKKVEDRIGVKLFDRSTNPITLTYAGERYVDVAKQMLILNKNLEREFRDIAKGKKGKIKIGIPRERAAYMLPIILPVFRNKYPEVKIHLHEGRTSELIESVIKGNTDLILIPSPRNKESLTKLELKTEFIYREKLVLISDESIIRQSKCTVKDGNQIDFTTIEKIPLLILKKGHGIRRTVDRLFDNHNIFPNIVMELSSNLTACRLAIKGVGAAIVPEMTLQLCSDINRKNIYTFSNNNITWDVVVAYRKDAYNGKIEKDFIEISRRELERYENFYSW